MIKNFDEFISYQETIEEGKVKNIAIAASIAMNLIFGAKYLKNHQIQVFQVHFLRLVFPEMFRFCKAINLKKPIVRVIHIIQVMRSLVL